ncbi:hypothetical protein B0H11DRAFT_2233288 [Mycena galericulata]|nr:hypothetical protein B0H11DRAFT_2233288 [Mycena galericulata]
MPVRVHRRSHDSNVFGLPLLLASGLAVLVFTLFVNGNGAETTGYSVLWNQNRTQSLVAREQAVSLREAEAARREAELLTIGAIATPVCPPCAAPTVFETITSPADVVIIEEQISNPPRVSRVQDILRRELRIAERERGVSKSEETVSRREHEASRRENWIMEQLVALRLEHEYLE